MDTREKLNFAEERIEVERRLANIQRSAPPCNIKPKSSTTRGSTPHYGNPAGLSTAGDKTTDRGDRACPVRAKQATYAEHTGERTQSSPDTAKHKLPAH